MTDPKHNMPRIDDAEIDERILDLEVRFDLEAEMKRLAWEPVQAEAVRRSRRDVYIVQAAGGLAVLAGVYFAAKNMIDTPYSAFKFHI